MAEAGRAAAGRPSSIPTAPCTPDEGPPPPQHPLGRIGHGPRIPVDPRQPGAQRGRVGQVQGVERGLMLRMSLSTVE